MEKKKEQLEREIKELDEKLHRSPNKNDQEEIKEIKITPMEELLVEEQNKEVGARNERQYWRFVKSSIEKATFLGGIILGIASSYFASILIEYLGNPIKLVLFVISILIIVFSVFIIMRRIKEDNEWANLTLRADKLYDYGFIVRWHKWRNKLTKELEEKKKEYKNLS